MKRIALLLLMALGKEAFIFPAWEPKAAKPNKPLQGAREEGSFLQSSAKCY
jgi:hypothetical protein